MDKILEKLDRKDGSNDNKVSVSAVKRQAKKEGYTLVDKKKELAKKIQGTADFHTGQKHLKMHEKN